MSTLQVPTSSWDAQVSLRHLAESMPIAVVIVDSSGKIIYVNEKLSTMFGYPPQEILGMEVEVLIPARFSHIHTHHRHGYMEHPHVRSMGSGMDLAGRRADGSEFPLEAGLSAITLDGEAFVVVTVTDITKRKQVERMLERQVEERTQEVMRRGDISEGVRSILANLISNRPLLDNLDFIAAQAARLLSTDLCLIYSRDDRLGTLQRRAMRGTLPDVVDSSFTNQLVNDERVFNEPMLIGKDRVLRPAFVEAVPDAQRPATSPWLFLTVPVRDSQIYGLMLFGFHARSELSGQDIDLALRMSYLTVLAFANAHLRAQIEHSAVAAERSRIARDLHDAVTQTLFSASIIAGVLPNIWQRNQEEGFRRLEELRELTRGALAEMRTLLLELRPAKLVEVDLSDLLRQLAEAISGRARIPVTVHVEGQGDIAPDVKVALYRVAQEALNNIAKHAQARNVLIHLRYTADQIILSVSDDGVGFVFERIKPQHLGLGIMRERADAIGASLNVISAPNEGTTIEVSWVNNQPNV